MKIGKFIAHAGLCARRKAVALILSGKIKVNNKLVTQLNYEVVPSDQVMYENKVLQQEKKVYILLNKPRGYITTLSDERGRKTVRELIDYRGVERIYPVGRLDRDTTGLLFFTNDGDLATRLSHPAQQIQKVYQVKLATPLKEDDLIHLKSGVNLADGFIKIDDIQVLNFNKTNFSLTLHSGKNRIIRRIFAHLGYEIKHLDRVRYASLSPKKLPLKAWRFLTHQEVKALKLLTSASL
ncbi:MAG: pseudouridine synthase [Bacteroidota bacterium]